MRTAALLVLSTALAGCGTSETERGGGRPDSAADATVADTADVATPVGPGSLELVGRPWRALGTEPFWGLEVSAVAIVFTEPAEEPLVFPPAEPRVEGGAAVLSTSLDDRFLQVTVRDTACSDGMSDREYDYSARVVLDGEALGGCALPDSTTQPAEVETAPPR